MINLILHVWYQFKVCALTHTRSEADMSHGDESVYVYDDQIYDHLQSFTPHSLHAESRGDGGR